jgi:rubrerythrin
MPWYTTDHARRDAERQAKAGSGLLDKPQYSKRTPRYECIHCCALYGVNDQCPRCGAFEARRVKES